MQFHNRVQQHLASPRPAQPPRPGFAPGSFLWYPCGALAGANPGVWAAQQWVYRQAFEQAQAVVRPSVLERTLPASWN